MKVVKLVQLALLVFGIILSGCQKEENLNDIIIDIDNENPTSLVKPAGKKATGNEQEVAQELTEREKTEVCNINFVIMNKMIRKLLIETYAQSAFIGMPEFRGGAGSRTGDCPEASLSDPVAYPTTMTLDYGAGCSPATGLDVEGILIVEFSGSIEEIGTEIIVKPQDNFKISGKDIDVSDPETITLNCTDFGMYNMVIATGEEIIMTEPNGASTTVDYIDGDNLLLYDDNGTNSGPLDVLDDVFTFFFTDMTVHCGNGSSSTVAVQEELVYDLTCDCIQAGVVDTYIGRDLFQTMDFGYAPVEGEEGECDDEILVTTYDDERSSGDEVVNCP